MKKGRIFKNPPAEGEKGQKVPSNYMPFAFGENQRWGFSPSLNSAPAKNAFFVCSKPFVFLGARPPINRCPGGGFGAKEDTWGEIIKKNTGKFFSPLFFLLSKKPKNSGFIKKTKGFWNSKCSCFFPFFLKFKGKKIFPEVYPFFLAPNPKFKVSKKKIPPPPMGYIKGKPPWGTFFLEKEKFLNPSSKPKIPNSTKKRIIPFCGGAHEKLKINLKG